MQSVKKNNTIISYTYKSTLHPAHEGGDEPYLLLTGAFLRCMDQYTFGESSNGESPNMHLKNFPLLVLFLLFFLPACERAGKSPALKSSKTQSLKSQVLFRNLPKEPENLHPIRSVGLYSAIVQSYVMETLLTRNLETYKWEPHLAEKWEEGPKHITFTLRDSVYWQDGQPLTAKDVVFSFKAYKDPSFGGARYLAYYENIESVEQVDNKTIRFKVKKIYFNNFNALAGLTVLPEHVYKDKEKKLSRKLLGSGPYVLTNYERGKKIQLTQNKNWWGRKVKPLTHRVPNIVFRFISAESSQLIRMTAGDLDYLSLTPEAFIKKTTKKPWGQSLIKKEIRNKTGSGYGFVTWNLTNPLFQSLKVRKALAHLMNRELMNQKFEYGKAKLATGPWYSWNDFADPSVLPISFDPKKAHALLREDGWTDSDKNGVLEKSIKGKKTELKFTLIFSSKDFEKYLTMYQEDLKKNGIAMSLRLMDWSAFLKVLNEKKFSAITLGWSGSAVDVDPKAVWHSESDREGGSNFISYKNPEVDRLIDQGRGELNRQKRVKIFQKVYRLIAEDVPYIFMFNQPVRFYAVSQKVKMERDTYLYGLGDEFWQLQPQ